MSREKCPSPQKGCKYFPDCFADRHHVVPQRLGRSALAKAYINLPENSVTMCRRLHETQAYEEPLPRKSVMRRAIAESALRGEVQLSKSKLKKLFNVDSLEELK